MPTNRRAATSRDSPDIDRSDYTADAEDIAAVLAREGGAHLVGHSYGGVDAMLAAALVPEHVKSLTLIEPGCYQAAADDPVTAAAIAANRDGHAKLPMDLPAAVTARLTGDRGDVAAALVEGDTAEVAALLGELAARRGAVVPTQSASPEQCAAAQPAYALHWLLEEVSISTDTTAAGGNASLMMI